MPSLDFKEFQDKFSTRFRPWHRSFHFWVRAADIYTGYKVFQLRVGFEKNVQKQEQMWELQHEIAAQKIYSMCSICPWWVFSQDFGYSVDMWVAQVIGKPDLAPAAWVRRLVTLCDQAAATPSSLVYFYSLEVYKMLSESLETKSLYTI
ncbi:hypothetical protein LguiA_015909 [Lonicera macranthoides]